MGKHKFIAGGYCEFCGDNNAVSLPRGLNGKFEAPDEGICISYSYYCTAF